MSEQTDNISNLLLPYGLSSEEIEVYLYLLKNQYSTALHLSRKIRMARTKVYRILDKLIAKQLVEQKLESRGMNFGATHPDRFKVLVTEKEMQVETLKQNLSTVVERLTAFAGLHGKESKVLYYTGEEGLKQVSYNSTRAKGNLRVFEVSHLSDFLDQDYAEYLRKQYVANQVLCQDLTNLSRISKFTENKTLIDKYSQYRYIPESQLKIEFETLIYNDVYCTYTYSGNEIFCIEIYNDQLASMQKQLYDFVWTQAMPMEWRGDQLSVSQFAG